MKRNVLNKATLAPLVFSAGAIGFGIYLLVFALLRHDTIRACGSGECDEVLNSPWAIWYGIPVVAFGVAMYVAYFVAFLRLLRSADHLLSRRLRLFLASIAMFIVLGAAYFVVIQGALLGAFCKLCMATHSLGVLAVVSGWLWNRFVASKSNAENETISKRNAPTKSQEPSSDMAGSMLVRQLSRQRQQVSEHPTRLQYAAISGIAVFLFAVFAVSHAYAVSHAIDFGPETHLVIEADRGASQSKTPSTQGRPYSSKNSRQPESQYEPNGTEVHRTDAGPSHEGSPSIVEPAISRVQLPGGIEFPRDRFPIIGSANASHVIVKLFDYKCNSCKDMHYDLKKTLPDYHKQFALILIPCPLERKCHPNLPESVPDHVGSCELARLSLAMWKAAPDRFEEYHEWLIETSPRPSLKSARFVAETFAGKQALQLALDHRSSFEADIKIAAELFRSNGISKMPKIFLPSGRIVIGATRNRKATQALLEEEIRTLSQKTIDMAEK